MCIYDRRSSTRGRRLHLTPPAPAIVLAFKIVNTKPAVCWLAIISSVVDNNYVFIYYEHNHPPGPREKRNSAYATQNRERDLYSWDVK